MKTSLVTFAQGIAIGLLIAAPFLLSSFGLVKG